jgi:transcriptional regulator with XRE-family HTH domain
MKTHRKPSQSARENLAGNLKKLRKARGYTQQELANFCRCTKSYISDVEQGTVNITLASLETIARGLGCSVARLVAEPMHERVRDARLRMGLPVW